MKSIIYNYFLKNNISLEYDVYVYSLTVIKKYLIVIFLTLPIAHVLKILTETLIFIFIFSLLRKYLGGFHLKHNYSCLILSVLVSILLPYLAVHLTNIKPGLLFVLIILDYIVTFIIGPIDHINKTISASEHAIYKKKALFIELCYTILTIICFIFNLCTIAYLLIFTITLNVASISLAFIHRNQKLIG